MIAPTRCGWQTAHVDKSMAGADCAGRVAAIASESAVRLPLFPDDDPSPGPVDQQPVDRPVPASDPFEFGRHLLALAGIRGIGFHTLQALLKHYGDLRALWEDDTPSIRDTLARAKVRDASTIASYFAANRARLLSEGEAAISRLARDNISVIAAEDPTFPQRLTDLPDGPMWLFVEGSPAALNGTPLVGVVGTREPSRQGIRAAKRLTSIVAGQGFGIVSGLAEGIDAAAHTMGLFWRVPQVAVLGTGIRVVFPQTTRRIRKRITDSGGAVISEYLPDDSYDRARFVQRNRLQAGLAIALCPVESRAKSGTAHTLRFSEKYGRPLFGVRLDEPAHENEMLQLLRDAGRPVFDLERTDDIDQLFDLLRHQVGDRWPEPPEQPNPEWLFRPALRALDEIEADFPLTDLHRRWLVNEIACRYNVQR